MSTPITDEQIDAALAAVARDAERFQVEAQNGSLFLVRDTMTNRVREATHDHDDAESIALWLNTGHVYAGGEPLAVV